MSDNRNRTKDKEQPISLAFPPDYAVRYMNENSMLLQLGLSVPSIRLSDERMDDFYREDGPDDWPSKKDRKLIAIDLPRTHWTSKDFVLNPNYRKDDEKSQNFISSSSESMANREMRAITAFSLLKNQTSVVQGGFYQTGYTALSIWAQVGTSFSVDVAQGDKHLSRNTEVEGDYRVRVTCRSSKAMEDSLMDSYSQASDIPKSPFVEADYNYRVKRDAANDGYQADIDHSDYSVKIDPVIWREIFIPKFTAALTSKKTLQEADVLEFVPMLIDPGFAKEFAKKLSQSDKACREYAHGLVEVCFKDRPEELVRIYQTVFMPEYMKKLKAQKSLVIYDLPKFVPMLSVPEFAEEFAKQLLRNNLSDDERTTMVSHVRDQINIAFKGRPDLAHIQKRCQENFDRATTLKPTTLKPSTSLFGKASFFGGKARERLSSASSASTAPIDNSSRASSPGSSSASSPVDGSQLSGSSLKPSEK